MTVRLFLRGKIFGATEPQVVNGVGRFETAAKTKPHKSGEISRILRVHGPSAAKNIAFLRRVAAVAGDHGEIEVRGPLPHQAVKIVEPVKICPG
ncbi:MAG: hypothetical protein JWN25_2087 [Verrucomicrobiales bacterium]|nr:hypothetical protein [Verrucomicrobiales bacterium]